MKVRAEELGQRRLETSVVERGGSFVWAVSEPLPWDWVNKKYSFK